LKIAVLTDAHGNLPALEAALAKIHAEGCDVVYHTGDAVGIGPYPAECVDRLLSVGARCVLGNHEAYLLDLWPHGEASGMGAEEVRHHAWVRASLAPALRAAIASWPWLVEDEIDGMRVAFLHYPLNPPGRDFGPFVHAPSVETLDPLFGRCRDGLAFYGHNHAASDVRGHGRYVNPGSLGCYTDPIARFAILDVHAGAYTLAKYAVPYDDMALLRAFVERDVPDRAFIRQTFFGR